VALVVNGQLLARENPSLRISNNFQPDLGGASVFAAALGHLGKLAARLGAKFCGQSNRQGL